MPFARLFRLVLFIVLLIPGMAPCQDSGSEVIDRAGVLDRNERIELLSAVRSLRFDNGLDVAVIFSAARDLETLQAEADRDYEEMRANGSLGPEPAIFAYGAPGLRTYKRHLNFDRKVDLEMVKMAWSSVTEDAPLERQVLEFLTELGSLASRAGLQVPGVEDFDEESAIASAPPPPRLDTAGALANAVVGPEGGRVVAPGVATLEFPPGIFDRDEQVVVRRVSDPPLPGGFISVECSADEPFAEPVRVVHELPKGVDLDRVLAVQEAGHGWFNTVPFEVDSAAGTLTAEVHHFSLVGWAENLNYRTWTALKGGAATGLPSGAVAIFIYGTELSVFTGPGAVVVAVIAVGAVAANPALDHLTRSGFDAQFNPVGFEILWAKDLYERPHTPHLTVAVDAQNKIYPMKYGRDERGAPTLGDKGQSIPEFMKDKTAIELPVTILKLAGALQYTRARYMHMGYGTPENTTVLVTNDVGTTGPPGSQSDAGKWDGAYLRLDEDMVWDLGRGKPEREAKLYATIAHEYWHALWGHNDMREVMPGLNESLATAFESIIFPDQTEFTMLYPWNKVTPVLGSGLLEANEEDYDSSTRGYALWPWGKWLFHSQGNDVIRKLGDMEMEANVRDAVFRAFTRGVLVEEAGLQAMESVDLPDGTSAESNTGWDVIDLGAQPVTGPRPNWTLGTLDVSAPGPLALITVRLMVPPLQSGRPEGPVIARLSDLNPNAEVNVVRQYEGRSILLRGRTLDDLVAGVSGVVIEPAWARPKTKGTSTHLPITIVTNGDYDEFYGEETLVAYRLVPPGKLTVKEVPGQDEFTIGWSVPDFGADGKPGTYIAGYQIVGGSAGGGERVVAKILYNLGVGSFPYGWHKGDDGDHVIWVDSGTTSAEIPRRLLQGYEKIGINSIDGFLRQGGSPVASETTWSGGSGGSFSLKSRGKPENLSCQPPGARSQDPHTFSGAEFEVVVDPDGNFNWTGGNDDSDEYGGETTKYTGKGRRTGGRMSITASWFFEEWEKVSTYVSSSGRTGYSALCRFSGDVAVGSGGVADVPATCTWKRTGLEDASYECKGTLRFQLAIGR